MNIFDSYFFNYFGSFCFFHDWGEWGPVRTRFRWDAAAQIMRTEGQYQARLCERPSCLKIQERRAVR
jgi:hypothetical protein